MIKVKGNLVINENSGIAYIDPTLTVSVLFTPMGRLEVDVIVNNELVSIDGHKSMTAVAMTRFEFDKQILELHEGKDLYSSIIRSIETKVIDELSDFNDCEFDII